MTGRGETDKQIDSGRAKRTKALLKKKKPRDGKGPQHVVIYSGFSQPLTSGLHLCSICGRAPYQSVPRPFLGCLLLLLSPHPIPSHPCSQHAGQQQQPTPGPANNITKEEHPPQEPAASKPASQHSTSKSVALRLAQVAHPPSSLFFPLKRTAAKGKPQCSSVSTQEPGTGRTTNSRRQNIQRST